LVVELLVHLVLWWSEANVEIERVILVEKLSRDELLVLVVC
jgi:hypothetical protein